MSASPKLQEPSMDEILASIRRIIADDELTSAPRRGSGEGAGAPSRRYEEDEAPAADARRWEPRAERRPQGSRREEGRAPDTRFQEARAQEMRAQEMRAQEPHDREPHDREPADRERHGREVHPRELDAHEMNGRELHGRELRGRPQPFADFDGLDALQELDAHLADLRASEERAAERRAEGRPPRSAPPRSPEGAEGRRPPVEAVPRFEERREPRAFPRDGEAERAPRRGADRREVRENLARVAGPAPQRPSLSAVPRGSEPEPSAPGGRRRDLLSPAADAAVASAMNALGDLVLPQRDRTVEDLVKEILRPMLKDWLDENLPDLVERLVRAEIERVVRSGR
ncbi:DUF2497 domain-containing protein [Xanthobacter sp. KR7-225]|uniref:DUF2497 domain-containing protein n=1 Tax=Xanthobacter sp. KR7-225 TaxID=3156613 RepID=UPI0032B3D304